MDLAKIESDFKTAMLPEFDNSEFSAKMPLFIFTVRVAEVNFKYVFKYYDFERYCAVLGFTAVFGKLKLEYKEYIQKNDPFITVDMPKPNIKKFELGDIPRERLIMNYPKYDEHVIINCSNYNQFVR